jgi:hypothetical protein
VKYHTRIHKNGWTKWTIIDTNQRSIASGIVHETAMLAKGAIMDTCQKLNIIIGRVKTKAESVSTNAVLISSISGRKENVFIKKLCVYMIHRIARKLK